MKKMKRNKKTVITLILGLIWSSLFVIGTQRYILQSEEYDYKANNKESGIDYTNSITYDLFNTRVTALENKVYPVGSVYISTTKSTTAQVKSLFGGTWEAIGQGRVLIGAGTNGGYTFTNGSTGGSTIAGNISTNDTTAVSLSNAATNPLGEYTHKLVTAELAKHSHLASYYINGAGNGHGTNQYGGVQLKSVYASGYSSNSAGSDYYHNNIQPYLVVYMYKRTA